MSTHILIIAHAPLASALRSCAAHVFADRLDTVWALDVQAQDTAEDVLAQARALRLQMGPAPVLVLSDVRGATPCNAAHALVSGTPDPLVCGVNLPMLWRALSYQHEAAGDLLKRAQEGAQQGICHLP